MSQSGPCSPSALSIQLFGAVAIESPVPVAAAAFEPVDIGSKGSRQAEKESCQPWMACGTPEAADIQPMRLL